MKNSLFTIILLFAASMVSAQVKPAFTVVASYYTESNKRYASAATLTYNDTEATLNNLSKLFVDKIYSSPNSIDAFFYDEKGYYQGQVITDINQEVYFGVDLGKDVTTTLTFSGTESFDKVLLLDKMTNMYYDLKATPQFDVYVYSGKNKNRFVIILGMESSIEVDDNKVTDPVEEVKDTTDVTSPVEDITDNNDDNDDNDTVSENPIVSEDTATGIDEAKADGEFSVYSSYKMLTVSTSGTDVIGEVSIIGMNGQIVKAVSVYDNVARIDMSNSPNGVYIVKATVGSETKTSKVVIR